MFRNVAYLVCDLQKRVLPHITKPGSILSSVNTIMQANNEYRRINPRARIHKAPVVVAEFLPKKLGPTHPSIISALPKDHAMHWEKPNYTMFNPKLDQYFKQQNVNKILLSGVQTEWCITQTAMDFQREGYDVEVLADGVGSSDDWEHEEALDRLKRRGVWVTTTHGWIVERLRVAQHPLTEWYIGRLKDLKNQPEELRQV